MAISDSSEAETPLLEDNAVVIDGFVDYTCHTVNRSSSGGWPSVCYIIGVEITGRFIYYGIESNLIPYLTGPAVQSMAAAAENVKAWSRMVSLLPLLGAVVAYSFLGRYWTIVAASLIYDELKF